MGQWLSLFWVSENGLNTNHETQGCSVCLSLKTVFPKLPDHKNYIKDLLKYKFPGLSLGHSHSVGLGPALHLFHKIRQLLETWSRKKVTLCLWGDKFSVNTLSLVSWSCNDSWSLVSTELSPGSYVFCLSGWRWGVGPAASVHGKELTVQACVFGSPQGIVGFLQLTESLEKLFYLFWLFCL